MTNPPILPPEVEKEFDERYKDAFAGGDMWNWEKGKEVKFFFAKVIAEEVEKAKREQIKKDAVIAIGIDKLVNPDEYYKGYYDARRFINKDILYQLTPDQLSE